MIEVEMVPDEYRYLRQFEADINTRIEAIADSIRIENGNNTIELIAELALVHFKLGQWYLQELST